jgi:hypothetical protein
MSNLVNIQTWNLQEGVPVHASAQRVFNVVGRIDPVDAVKSLSYSLNQSPFRPVHFRRSNQVNDFRLLCPGDFNIDTIGRSKLAANNRLTLRASLKNGLQEVKTISFPRGERSACTDWQLDLKGIKAVQQVAQIVDGNWTIGHDQRGEFLQIRPEDAGYDRIILFGGDRYGCDCSVELKLCVGAWRHPQHSAGIVFNWNPHKLGDGTHLPTQWTTGLANYDTRSHGIRLRTGQNVHINHRGHKIGDHLLGESNLSPTRYLLHRLARRLGLTRNFFPQMQCGPLYTFQLDIHKQTYRLRAFKEHQRRPQAQILVTNPHASLPPGAFGVMVYQAAVRIYDFKITTSQPKDQT